MGYRYFKNSKNGKIYRFRNRLVSWVIFAAIIMLMTVVSLILGALTKISSLVYSSAMIYGGCFIFILYAILMPPLTEEQFAKRDREREIYNKTQKQLEDEYNKQKILETQVRQFTNNKFPRFPIVPGLR